jgi:hypothetical protein
VSSLRAKQVWELKHNGMTAAPKLSSPLKLPRGGNLVCRTAQSYGEAAILWEETGMSTKGAPRGRDPGTYARIVEITSGRAISQQGLVKIQRTRADRDAGSDLVWRMSL